ncbi:sulfite exporter TauE/SafE family protein [Pandoraea cepalis]|uniref:Probable membrane transporter protein n=1 Tax=Pandoraea cepalis TaxID=2508294 RepID=A0A5E4R8D9_9BURK|nr:TSUP family transporter [Pandoraea cepalis]VVD59530.1 membrane protein [Pandoraea cepalis]
MLTSWALTDWLMLAVGAFVAGLVDAVVGGGGLVSVPTLFAVFPNAAPPLLFGTNKLAGIWGTASAALRYARGIQLRWAILLPATVAAFLFSFCGAYAVSHVPADVLRKLLPFVLTGVAIYTLRKKDFGTVHAPVTGGMGVTLMAIAVGGAIGFYDGFFGPGTGSFLVFLFVRLFGQDFVNASASAKIVNVATNLAALWLFGMGGHVAWQVGLGMAVMNVLGSQVGSRLALKRGVGFVRRMFLCVLAVLIVKTGYDALLRG